MRLKLFTFFVLVSISSLSWAQGSTERMYSFAFKGASLETLPKILNDKDPAQFTFIPIGEVSFLINENQLNYRFNASAYHLDKNIQNSSSTDEMLNGKVQGYSVSFGVIKNITYSTLQPYYGFDIGYRYQRFIGNSNQITNSYEANTNKSGAFLAPTIGIKWNIVPDFTVFAESNLQIYYNYERVNQKYTNGAYTFSSFNKFEFLMNPVKFGLQFSFGSLQ